MKQLIIFAVLFISNKGLPQNPDAIVGKWLKANKEDLIIDVYKVGDEYEGKINWSKDNKKPVGFLMLEDLRYDPDSKRWEDGKIHDPNSNRTYNASVVMNSDGTIEVKGSILFFSSKRVFKRVQ